MCIWICIKLFRLMEGTEALWWNWLIKLQVMVVPTTSLVSVLQTHSISAGRAEGGLVLLWVRVCCNLVFSQGHSGPYAWWVQAHLHMTSIWPMGVAQQQKLMGVCHGRVCTGQACLQLERPEGQTGLQEKNVTCSFFWNHEAQRGDSPPGYVPALPAAIVTSVRVGGWNQPTAVPHSHSHQICCLNYNVDLLIILPPQTGLPIVVRHPSAKRTEQVVWFSSSFFFFTNK